jgi:hypothetical protein
MFVVSTALSAAILLSSSPPENHPNGNAAPAAPAVPVADSPSPDRLTEEDARAALLEMLKGKVPMESSREKAAERLKSGEGLRIITKAGDGVSSFTWNCDLRRKTFVFPEMFADFDHGVVGEFVFADGRWRATAKDGWYGCRKGPPQGDR